MLAGASTDFSEDADPYILVSPIYVWSGILVCFQLRENINSSPNEDRWAGQFFFCLRQIFWELFVASVYIWRRWLVKMVWEITWQWLKLKIFPVLLLFFPGMTLFGLTISTSFLMDNSAKTMLLTRPLIISCMFTFPLWEYVQSCLWTRLLRLLLTFLGNRKLCRHPWIYTHMASSERELKKRGGREVNHLTQ